MRVLILPLKSDIKVLHATWICGNFYFSLFSICQPFIIDIYCLFLELYIQIKVLIHTYSSLPPPKKTNQEKTKINLSENHFSVLDSNSDESRHVLSVLSVPGPMIHMHHPQNLPNTPFADRETKPQGDGVTCLRFHSSEVMESGYEPEPDPSCLNHHLKPPPLLHQCFGRTYSKSIQ